MKNIYFQTQEAQWIPSKYNTKENVTRHIIFKFMKAKEKKFLEVAKENNSFL